MVWIYKMAMSNTSWIVWFLQCGMSALRLGQGSHRPTDTHYVVTSTSIPFLTACNGTDTAGPSSPTYQTQWNALQKLSCSSSGNVESRVLQLQFILKSTFSLISSIYLKKNHMRSHVLQPLLGFVIWLFKTNNVNSDKTSVTNKNTFPNGLEWNRSETARHIFLELVLKEEGSRLSAHDESGAWAVSTQQLWRDRPQDQWCD